MAQTQLHTTCGDCVNLLQHAATILSGSVSIFAFSPSKPGFLQQYDKQYHSRLLANVASSKCHMCALLHESIPELSEPYEAGKGMKILVRKRYDDPLAVIIELIYGQSDGYGVYEGQLRVHEAGHGNFRIVNSSQTWSLESLNCIRSWLESCILCHDKCVKPRGSRTLPRRLVDVNTTGTLQIQPLDETGQIDFDRLRLADSNGVRIVSTESLLPDTEYLTLSHRWGNPPGLVLSQETALDLADDMSPHLLKCADATVFQHAIHVTRSLGFRYIWIDALCIVQDDELEKRAEIMRMDDIYFNSKLNISAAEADHSRGLIFDRRHLSTNPCMATVKVPGSHKDISMYVFGEYFAPTLWGKPLDKRGWVFQERSVSPRIVRFTKDQVFWECWSLTASEVLPKGLPYEEDNSLSYMSGGFDFDKSIGIAQTGAGVQQIKLRWDDLVERYSRTCLTFGEDRLLAISALAKRFCSAMCMDQSEYLAGMWKDDLPLSLTWRQNPIHGRNGPEDIGSNFEMGYAPSWSWASVMVPVTMFGLVDLVPATEVVDIEVKRRSPNFFDGTHFCQLRLHGPMCKFRRYLQDGTSWIQIADESIFEEVEPLVEKDKSISMDWDTARKFAADEYFLLNISTLASDQVPREVGLILLRTPEKGTYKRVGRFQVPLKCGYTETKLEDAFEGHLDTLNEDDYLDLDSVGKYTINLI